jgi:hypothetical protein
LSYAHAKLAAGEGDENWGALDSCVCRSRASWYAPVPTARRHPHRSPSIRSLEPRGRGGESRRWYPAACPACGGVVIFEADHQANAIVRMHPEAIGEWEVSHIPAEVQAIWDEAVKVYRVGANASAVVACGRALEAAAAHRHIEGKTLQQRIQKMLDGGLITTEFKDAMDYVRLIRNVGAHAGKEVSRESAEGTMRFMQQTLRLLFEVPGELSRLTGHPPELDVEEEPPA